MSTYTFDEITYTYSGSTASVTSATSVIVTATILSSFSVSSVTYNVTSIGNAAFQGKTTLTSATIPNSVTSIAINGFQNCPNMTSVSLGNSMISIGGYAFDSCSKLTSISFPNTLTSLSGEAHFRFCSKLVSASLGTSLTTIPQYMFDSCVLLASITIPSSVTSIGRNAFFGCIALTPSVTIPNLVTAISIFAFQNCTNLVSVTLPTNASFTTIASSTFQSCTSLASITIPSSVTTISSSAFQSCTSLTSVIIPSAVATIGNSAFQSCTSLTNVYFLRTPLLATPGTSAFSVNPPTSVGKYYATVTNSSVIAPFFTSLATISLPTLTSMTAFTSTSSFAVVVISYANLAANGNESVDTGLTYVFLVNSVSSGSLSIGATEGSATAWNASTNKTIGAGTNAYWTPPGPSSTLWDAFSVVIQDSLGAVSTPNVLVQVAGPYPCFLEGTKILCFENNEEVYRPVETLRKGDLVKTICHGYMPINMICTTNLYNPGNDYRIVNRLYKCPKEKYPTLFEDLYITGCHSILVSVMTDDQWENTKAVNKNIYVTDNHFRLIACADEKAEPYNKAGYMNIYHIALDHHDIYMNYGIYANGLLVESCSIECLIYSNMKIMGHDDLAVSQDGDNVSTNMIQQLVDTY